MIWNLRANDYGWSLVPIERSISAGGKLSKGRNVALKRLKEKSAEIRHLTDQDRAVASYIKEVRGWSYSTSFELRNPKALLELAGHPLIFADAEGTKPLELVKEQPHVSLQESKAGTIRVQLSPKADYNTTGLELIRESSTRYLILQVTETVVRLANALGGLKAEFPSGLRDRVTKAIGSLAGDVLIESDHLDLTSEQAETLPADAVPIFRLYPHGEGLHVRLLVRPLPSVETVHAPGEGKAVLFAMLDGKPVRAQRDLKAEKSAAMKLLEACPTFAESRGENGEPWAALLESPRDCLNLLAELHELNQEQELVRAEWPEGQSFQLRAVADGSQFHLSLGGSTDWLTATGELKMNDELVLSMRQLLDLMESSSPHPGFLQLEDGQFLALTTKFQRQLEDLRSFSQPGKGDAVKIHPLAALAMEDLTETPNAKIGAAWKKQLKRLRESSSAKPPHPPSTLQAELRPYQLEGYRWLRRLADWGMGACLADDMGLGKTVQTLALLLDRAKDGPALVVAPTSVAANWLEETMRFAPALSPILYGRNGENREEVLADLGPFDLLIVSYGLLQFDSEAISQISWHTAILDEAQAIKNRATKRSQAVMKLKADFRLVTTGTPVENRLAELHNLFNFTNPGLLGSWDRFRTTFADPIERQEDEKARERLRRLIRPFMLRRLKSAVLQDLPSRTEIGLQVELSPEEAAFYEALRQKAVEELESASQEAEPGQVAIRILSQLTRLRRACCHPKLVDPGTSLGGSKLSVFSDTLEEILAGNHKVLVFSQFVDHLQIVRQHLEAQKISYQYLDGSSPAAKRQQAVRDFQSGIGDVFLISLKAGGFGLNLTAADYVIHMDPWWNPAAEDQASDRAHRIGQTRPVTVYRLITTGTIEEKILNLHHRKRELADSILEGTDSAGRITPEDMLELLRS